ncbi:MAG TPA: tol-pal system protein YbgF [Longimicrobiaceae bacterium]|nr:tol-pal system protein YbgF [Longimicrobiaceae bacterium]
MSARRLAALLLLPLLGGCATKRDLRDLRTEIQVMREAQDSALREIQRQNREMLDSLASQELRTRGDLANRLLQIERQVVQVQELTGQGQQRLNELREQLNARQQELARQAEAQAATNPDTAGGASSDNPGADELFNTSMASMRRRSFQTARAGFQEFLRLYPRHRLAPDALFYVAETYNETGDDEQALQAYARVVQLHPTSPRAPTALYRAGLIEVERGNRTQARALFDRVVRSYAQSPEAVLARDQIRRLSR